MVIPKIYDYVLLSQTSDNSALILQVNPYPANIFCPENAY